MFNEIKDLELLLCTVHLKNILINQALSAQCESAARGFYPMFTLVFKYRILSAQTKAAMAKCDI